MEIAPLSTISSKESIKKSFKIKQDSKIYNLNIEILNKNIIILNISEEKELYKEYEINLTFQELKQMDKAFSIFNSSQEFIGYMKALIENNKLTIIKENEVEITIKIIVEYLFKQNIIQIGLKLKKINTDIVIKDVLKQITDLNNRLKTVENEYSELKEENNNLKNENKKLKEEIKILKKVDHNKISQLIESIKKEIVELKNDNKIIKEKQQKLILNKLNIEINSSIMKEGELEMIKSAIEEKMNLTIKEFKKIFQASVDGGEPQNFFDKCWGIENTLVLYECWENSYKEKSDKNCFLFSLDKKKIYTIKDNNYFKIASGNEYGPSFVHKGIYCIKLHGNAFGKNSLITYEKIHPDIFNGERDIFTNINGVQCKEYEIFQVIF